MSETSESQRLNTVVCTLDDKPGALANVLDVIKEYDVNLQNIRSSPSATTPGAFDIHMDFLGNPEADALSQLREALAKECSKITEFGTKEAPWFPRRPEDLDNFVHKTLDAGEDLESDHPGFSDAEYRQRRNEIVGIAKNFRHGQPIPRVEYTDVEKETWRVVYTKLRDLYTSHACRQYLESLPLLEEHCGYSADNIPQLEDISNFLKKRTGFSLRPVAGLLSARDFLNGLAFRVFHSTQYLRHHTKPLYTPEPDICHELLGHVPMFCDPEFAEFSQQIGLASLGVSDADIDKLATLYWFTVEFGICRQDGEIKAYGAGLLSSFGELEYCVSDEPEVRDFVPDRVAIQEYPITTYQPVYFCADSFKEMTARMREYAANIERNFVPHFNPWTMEVEILDSPQKIASVLGDITQELVTIQRALANTL